jgi:uncharacterized protein YfeS
MELSEANVDGKTWSIFVSRSPSTFGGGAAYFAMNFIEENGLFETGLAQLEIIFAQNGEYVPFFSKGSAIRDGSNGGRARWESYLATLPKRRFARKTGKLALELRGDVALDFQDKIYLINITRDQIRVAASMISSTLLKIKETLKPVDGVDLTEIIVAADALAQREWQSDEAMRKDLAVAFALDRARIAAMDPWSKIDMTGYHKNARKILDQPSDWNQIDDFSPHGNDLGADILGDWPALKRMSVHGVAKRFEIDLQSDASSMDRIQLYLALAFGHVKKVGVCPPDLALETLAILDRDLAVATLNVVDEHRATWIDRMARYMQILQLMATPSA